MNNLEINNSIDFYKESIRFIRTNISHKNSDKIIAITSCKENKGKIEFVYYLSKSFSKIGKKVVLLDLNFKENELSNILPVKNQKGIIEDIIANKKDLKSCLIEDDDCDKLNILISGINTDESSEILDSEDMRFLLKKLSDIYDYVIINTPPAGIFTDAAIVSTMADGIVIAVKSNSTTTEELLKTVDNLRKVDANIIGTVLIDNKY
ncbi:CpsD/CapB family tyrosine-protein kinase [Anaerococcus vaginalis]|uniref:CpsD/CapB family tyrosine-protein kinase n=1 Tax=Anaerococcus vaginalis TaxID=33037 RepID=UPI0028FF72B9|nr:CpsD/CapB family tyrosine-protein kinase [Anaerococcus vaginalis]MDU2648465.1 CpsD/CapB family tyrosine-protein kinase [Anaerococcus vaginalis]